MDNKLADYITSYSFETDGGYIVWNSGRIEQWGWKTYSGVSHGATNIITLYKPYTVGYSISPGFQLENIGWGKYEISSYTLTNFSWRIVSSSGNYQTAPRRFSWYTVGK